MVRRIVRRIGWIQLSAFLSGAVLTVAIFSVLRPVAQGLVNYIYRPVAVNFQIHSLTPDGGKGSRGWQLVEWSVEKIRDCDYRGMRWQLLTPDGRFVDLDWNDFSVPGRDRNRPKGTHGVIVTRVGSTSHINNWHVTVRHNCNRFLPDVITILWPKDSK